MELLNMMDHQSVRLWAAQVIVIFFLIGGTFLLAVGISLIINSAGALRFFGGLNQWVSMRRATKSLEIPRDTQPAVQKYRYWIAAMFVLGGFFALTGLLTRFDPGAFKTLLGLNRFRPVYAAWVIDALRWILIVGNLAAIAAAVMLAFFPDTLMKLEARGSHWYSERQATRGADTMRVTSLDNWVAVNPRAAGAIIVLFALGLLITFGMLLPGVW